jgi:carbon monoxide dehydrogenase subunit G
MARWFPLESADADLFTTAPHVFVYEAHFAAPPQRVWESLASDESIAAWGSSVSSVTWTSPRPLRVGATREVGLGPSKVHEHFYRWDEGHGYAFYVYEANAPLFRRFAEDYVLEPDGDGTRFIWKVAIEPKPALALPFKALAPVLKAAFGRVPGEGKRYFDQLT